MEQFLTSAVKAFMASQGIVLPDITLADVPLSGRLDVAMSHTLESLCSSNPISSAIFKSTRPIIDGLLVQSCGPSAIRTRLKPIVGEAGVERITEALEIKAVAKAKRRSRRVS